MKNILQLFENNRKWAESKIRTDPGYFKKLVGIQKPEYLWIGCADSRVPANEITGLRSGELFVHRNVANLVPESDTNALSVIEFAIEKLNIQHIILCGHYRCSGVKAALDGELDGHSGRWLKPLADCKTRHQQELEKLCSEEAQWDRLCEINVLEQVGHIRNLELIRRAWRSGRELFVHGWIYSLENGRIRDLDITAGRDS